MKNKPYIFIITALLIMTAAISCNKTDEFAEAEQLKIQEYLERNSSLNFEIKPSGLYYLEQITGTGNLPVKFDTAYLWYTGKFLDGQIFDSNVNTSKQLEVIIGSQGVIPGFAEGISYMKQGGKSLFLIPSALGYGSTGNYYGGISGYTPLLFEVQLVLLKKGPGK
jgi:FKBP-type peptidyl-prolyl cis-trans isomerase FkpA